MMAPLPPAPTPPPGPPADRPELPRVRLDVRTGSGRSVSYEVGADEFLVGGAAGCDLRLPVAGLPPVVAQITRKPDGVKVRRLAPGLPVLLNAVPLPSNTATALEHGDHLAVAGVEITVAVVHPTFVAPKLIPLDPGDSPPVTPPALPDAQQALRAIDERRRQLDDEDGARRAEWQRKDAELIRRRRDLDRQTEDLESDRAIWYRRRQEFEQEFEQRRAAQPGFSQKQAELTAREQELARARDELAVLREQLAQQYQERRDQLAQMQEVVREAVTKLQADRQAFEAEREAKRQELTTEADERRARLDEELRRRREAFEAELTERTGTAEAAALDRHRDRMTELDRSQESLREASANLAERRRQLEAEAERAAAERLRQAEEEIARRRAAFEQEVAEYEPRLRELRAGQDRLAVGFQDLARQRDTLAADRDVLDRARETLEAETAAETERRQQREKSLSDREADVVRQEESLRADRESHEQSRQQLTEDLLRLDRREAAAEERERDLAAREREAGVRVEQLKRDAAEWEQTVRLAAAEEERLRAEAERLDRQKADLDAQTVRLAERAGQLEAQQAVLAVMRAKLDRTRAEAEQEAAALAAARAREDEAQVELRARIREAEQLRAELSTVQEDTAQERRRLEERDSLLTAGLEEIRLQKESLAAEEARLRERSAELDARSAEFAEQAGAMKGRMAQALDLQARLEADRVAIREREAALAQAEEARQALQEQLRRRAEDLTTRGKALDEIARQLAVERTAFEQGRTTAEADRAATAEAMDRLRTEVEARAANVGRQSAALGDREAALGRQVERLKEVGQAVAAERKSLTEARAKWEADRTAAEEDARKAREELDAFRRQVAADVDTLRAQAPELEDQAKAALDRLASAKDALRGHLTELNAFARQSREDLDAVRAQVRLEAERLREQEQALDRARADHRLAVTAFRQQLIDWQARVAEMRRGLVQSESRLEARQAAVDEAARQVDATSLQLAEQAEQLRREREEVVVKRTEMERHLADMREWYRKKLRELAGARSAERGARGSEPDEPPFDKPRLAVTTDATDADGSAIRTPHSALAELDPGDRQLGELLRSLELVDADTLTTLWAEAHRQRRTLRQVLLASGAVTLYQLALIEAGTLDGLVVGRFRVIDRLRVTTREAIYRVFDPTRPEGTSAGVFLLRHLSESEAQDAVHPDEFRQRFAAARDAAHPNLAAVVEVLEVGGRPAVVEEWLTGLFSADWPAHAAHPGCWVRLATMAARGIDAAHRAGLVHGRLTSDSFVLTVEGVLKVTGFGEPAWLAAGVTPSADPVPATDLRALGQVLFGWSQLAAKRRGPRPAKSFPPELVAVIRRLEADAEPPMADTVAADRPYESAAELLAELKQIARETVFSDDAWEKLLRHVADHAPDGPAALRQSA
jgi:uncharacterized phage infection (PIP) family protein YhgE